MNESTLISLTEDQKHSLYDLATKLLARAKRFRALNDDWYGSGDTPFRSLHTPLQDLQDYQDAYQAALSLCYDLNWQLVTYP